MQMKTQPESAPGPLTKVLEHLKDNNFAFGRFLSALEKFGEKQTWISAQYKNNWTSEFFQSPYLFSRSYFKFGSDLDPTPINKVIDLALTYKFAFGQNLSSVLHSSEKLSWKPMEQTT